ncbi:MAG: tRNA-dihydrouridine synthase [Pseudomonadales bacterium]|nr:tRNA-dihydrouridine synthase [Pseudomonadales bacterium]
MKPSFIMLAPMEGIIDHTMRDMFSAIGGLDRCVTEFIRVTSQCLPERVFKRGFPEIQSGSKTSNNTVVYAQLLGDKPEIMAQNAYKLARMGAAGIDINFGCPAKCVNNHGGGSILLKDPEQLFRIIHSVRQYVPIHIPVSAKIRLGFEDKSLSLDIAAAIEAAGASEIAVHGRTKKEGYKPPAYWDKIGEISDLVNIPVIANGEMWTLTDIQRCIKESKTTRIMLGRGLVACPDLALLARGDDHSALNWAQICLLLLHYRRTLNGRCPEKYINSLIKQWLVYLRQQYPQAHLFFNAIKRLRCADDLEKSIIAELRLQQQRQECLPTIGNLDLSELHASTL